MMRPVSVLIDHLIRSLPLPVLTQERTEETNAKSSLVTFAYFARVGRHRNRWLLRDSSWRADSRVRDINDWCGARHLHVFADHRDGHLGFRGSKVQGQLGVVYDGDPALLGRPADSISPLQRPGIQREEQSRGASGKNRYVAHPLHRRKLRCDQATVDGVVANAAAEGSRNAG